MRSVGVGLVGLIAGVVVLGAVLAPGNAEACSPAICRASAAPADGKVVPANAPALVINPDQGYSSAQRLDAGTIQLLDLEGTQVAFTVEQQTGPELFLVRPAELQSGQQYRLSFSHPCYQPVTSEDAGVINKVMPSSSTPERVEVTFEAGPSSPLPMSLGTVTATASAQVVQAGTYCGSCTAPLAAATAQLEITPSAELTPYLSTTRFRVTVDGAHWAFGDYGDPMEGTPYPGGPVRSIHTVFASCGTGDTYVYDLGVAPGRRRIEVSAEVAGAAENPPPVTLNVDLDCSPWDTMERPTEVCWYQSVDAGQTGPGNDGGTDPSGNPPSGGCSGTWFGGAALLGAAVFRRRPR